MDKLPISLVIITLNEENNIKRCIESAPFVSEVILVDSGSQDKTIEVAESLGAKTFYEPWKGFYHQKNTATQRASFRWVLSLDADEALSEEAVEEIIQVFQERDFEKFEAYSFPRLSYHLGRWIHHGGWYPDRQLRLFQKDKAQWVNSNVHEHIQAQTIKKLKNPILHYVFRDLAHQVETNNRYSTLGTLDLISKGKRFSYIKLFFKPLSKFVETYFLKRGFLDGIPGFIIAVGASYSIFLKFAKLWEAQKMKKTSQRLTSDK